MCNRVHVWLWPSQCCIMHYANMHYAHVRLNPAERPGSVRRHAAVRHSLHVLADQVTHLPAEATNMKSFFAFRCLM